jgi:cation-transporting P-type ATPase 13A2
LLKHPCWSCAIENCYREQAESGLTFLGLIVFENKLKPGTTPAIQALRSAHLVCRMVTGDNPRTAVSVARECGMINPAAHVFSPAFVQGDFTSARAIVTWTSVDDESLKLDPYSLRPQSLHDTDGIGISYQDYTIAITGDVFRWMVNHAPIETLQRVSMGDDSKCALFMF